MITKTGLQLSSLTPYLDTKDNIVSTLKKVSEIGCRYVQLQGIPANIDNAFLADTLAKSGLICAATQEDYPFGFSEHYEEAVERAVKCGAKYLAFALIPKEVDSAEKLAEFSEKIRHIGDYVKNAGLKFSFHPIGADYTLMDGVPRYERLLTLLPNMGLTFCVGAAFGSPVKPEEVFAKFGDRIDLVHFKESIILPDGKKQLVPLGEGEHEWKSYYNLCEKYNVAYVFAEQEHWQCDAFDAVRASYKYMEEIKVN